MTKPAAIAIPKIRGAFKKINNLGHMINHHRSSNPNTPHSSTSNTPSTTPSTPVAMDNASVNQVPTTGAEPISGADNRLLTVYVGKSRRAYRVEPELLDHPILQELVERSSGSGEILVACEVVMFDHFRWMIQNSDPQVEHLDDLKDFYAY